MRRRAPHLVLPCLLLVLPLLVSGPLVADDAATQADLDTAASADAVIAQNLEARGGHDAWKQVEAAKIQGMIEMTPQLTVPFTLHLKRPDKVRMSIEMGGMEITQAYDGTTGWQTVPAQGRVDVQSLEGPPLEAVKRQADFEGPLIDWKAKGHTITYGGLETVDGQSAHRLDLTLDGGEEVALYLDAETHLEIQQVGEAETMMGPTKMTIRYDDYQTIDGLTLAHEYSMMPEGAPMAQVVRFESVEVLDADEVDDELFADPR